VTAHPHVDTNSGRFVSFTYRFEFGFVGFSGLPIVWLPTLSSAVGSAGCASELIPRPPRNAPAAAGWAPASAPHPCRPTWQPSSCSGSLTRVRPPPPCCLACMMQSRSDHPVPIPKGRGPPACPLPAHPLLARPPACSSPAAAPRTLPPPAADFNVVDKKSFQLQGFAFLRDFMITENYYVVFQNPVTGGLGCWCLVMNSRTCFTKTKSR
jgi:hypothetical protein